MISCRKPPLLRLTTTPILLASFFSVIHLSCLNARCIIHALFERTAGSIMRRWLSLPSLDYRSLPRKAPTTSRRPSSHVRIMFLTHDHRPTTRIFDNLSSQQEYHLHNITCPPFQYPENHDDSGHNLIVGRIGCDGGTASCRHAGRSTFTPLMQHDHLKSRLNLSGSSMKNSTRAPRFDVEGAVNLRLCGLKSTDGRDF